MKCNVCKTGLTKPLYESDCGQSLTSLCEIYDGITRVWACSTCGHLQSDELDNVDAYYDHEYTILVESDEEDQIYEVCGGKPVYRTQHQVATFLDKMDLPADAKLLDYGCAKGSTIKALLQHGLDIDACLFDVSERYIPFWKNFIPETNWAIYRPKDTWKAYFDVVTSFFSLEHIVQPALAVCNVVDLLKPGGYFYCVVPNVLTNTADFIVVDHVNHFTKPSLTWLLEGAGLEVVEIDDTAHRGAFVIVAKKLEAGASGERSYQSSLTVEETVAQLENVAEYWRGAEANVRAFEAALDADAGRAIYGSGFYGAFIASCLLHPEKVHCYLDQNPFLQGRIMNGKPVMAPVDLSADIKVLFVGLNPAHARKIIASVELLKQRALHYFFL